MQRLARVFAHEMRSLLTGRAWWAMVLLLASDAGEWITGQTYPVNGGYSFAL